MRFLFSCVLSLVSDPFLCQILLLLASHIASFRLSQDAMFVDKEYDSKAVGIDLERIG